MKRLIINSMLTPDGTVLTSKHRHDYVTYIDDTNKEIYMVDGGLDYSRRITNGMEKDLSVYLEDGVEAFRSKLEVITKKGTQFLADVDTQVIQSALIGVEGKPDYRIHPHILIALEMELAYRGAGEIHPGLMRFYE